MKKLILFVLLLAAIAAGVLYANERYDWWGSNEALVEFRGVMVRAEVRDTPQEREQGLSGQESLEENTGMLFVYDEPGFPGFWMKDMNFPIDIIWMDENFEVVDLDEQLDPSTYPRTFEPYLPAQYVLEVPAGFVTEHGVEIGERSNIELP